MLADNTPTSQNDYVCEYYAAGAETRGTFLRSRGPITLAIGWDKVVITATTSLSITGISSQIRTKLRDWAVWQARGRLLLPGSNVLK